jgi:polysaccharide export outer membrane protein
MDVCKTDAIPRELDKVSGPEYVVEPPDIIYVEGLNTLPTQPLVGEKLVRPDGTINLGFYGDLHVAGLTLSEIEAKIEERLRHYVKNPRVHVDMAAFNSKVFYVVGQVVQPGRVPWTGNETVLDAIMLAGGITNFTNKCDIRLVRPTPECGCDIVLPVDYAAIINCGDTTTNYQILPGDRLVVPSTVGFEAAVWLDNFLTPVERVFGFVNLARISTINYNNFRGNNNR